jgi:CheY-like chemotaxis protein
MFNDEIEVLLVEDDPEEAEFTDTALRDGAVRNPIHLARDGEEALDFLFRRGQYHDREQGRPLLVILDLKLPRVDGIEVLRALRSHQELNNVPVVVLTSSREPTDISTCYQLGANSYLHKLPDFKRFCEAMRQLGAYWLRLNHYG